MLEDFLSEYQSERTRKLVNIRLQKFLEWNKQTPEELSKLTSKEARHLILQFQSDLKGKVKNNTLLSYISAAKNFFEFNDITINKLQGKLVKPQKAEGYHVFSNGDLGKMLEVANVQYKALIATAASTGWSISDILRMNKNIVANLIKRAEEEGNKFIYFKSTRKKTNSDSLCVLNPLAIEWLSKWLLINKGKSLFGVKEVAIGIMLKKLAKQASIITAGKIRFHNIRKWCISSLSKAGFNEFQIKYIAGKKIPLTDATYLQGLEEQIREKYPEAYDKYLNIQSSSKILTSKDEEIKNLEAQLETLRTILVGILGKDKLERIVKKTLKPGGLAEDSMFPKLLRKDEEMDNTELLNLYAELLKKSGRA